MAVAAISLGRESARPTGRWRAFGASAIVLALVAAVFAQRATIASALRELPRLSVGVLLLLVVFAVLERWSRADIVRRLLNGRIGAGESAVSAPVSRMGAVAIHDVGTAVSKGVPLGGALGTALRWTMCREAGVEPPRFATTLVAYGIATTFASWLLPLIALVVDMTQRSVELLDIVLVAGMAAMLIGSVAFWSLVLRSDRLEAWGSARTERVWKKLSYRFGSLSRLDPVSGVSAVRAALLQIGRRPWELLGRTLAAQTCGAILLLITLRSLGVGDELGSTEFFRVFFIAHLLGTFAPTPGGVGVVEAGVTGALVAAGADTSLALAGVLVYRLLTYVVPIAFGAALYLAWRSGLIRLEEQSPSTL